MLYIIRHGMTDWNAMKKLQGRTDIPLNEEGRRMAYEARDEYAKVHFDVCYSSPLKRARETAEILLEGRDIPIIFDDSLKEMNFGEYEGITDYFESDDYPVNVFFKHPENYHSPSGGAESIDSLFERTGLFLDNVVYPLLREGKDVLIVGHGAMNCSIVCQIRNLQLEDFWSAGIPNCKLMKLELNMGLSV